MLDQHHFNQNPLSFNHEYNCEYIFSEHFLNTPVLNLATSNDIFDIRTVLQKCQPFPTHGNPLSPKQDTNSGAINLLCFWPPAGPNNSPPICIKRLTERSEEFFCLFLAVSGRFGKICWLSTIYFFSNINEQTFPQNFFHNLQSKLFSWANSVKKLFFYEKTIPPPLLLNGRPLTSNRLQTLA